MTPLKGREGGREGGRVSFPIDGEDAIHLYSIYPPTHPPSFPPSLPFHPPIIKLLQHARDTLSNLHRENHLNFPPFLPPALVAHVSGGGIDGVQSRLDLGRVDF